MNDFSKYFGGATPMLTFLLQVHGIGSRLEIYKGCGVNLGPQLVQKTV